MSSSRTELKVRPLTPVWLISSHAPSFSLSRSLDVSYRHADDLFSPVQEEEDLVKSHAVLKHLNAFGGWLGVGLSYPFEWKEVTLESLRAVDDPELAGRHQPLLQPSLE